MSPSLQVPRLQPHLTATSLLTAPRPLGRPDPQLSLSLCKTPVLLFSTGASGVRGEMSVTHL